VARGDRRLERDVELAQAAPPPPSVAYLTGNCRASPAPAPCMPSTHSPGGIRMSIKSMLRPEVLVPFALADVAIVAALIALL